MKQKNTAEETTFLSRICLSSIMLLHT